MKKKARSIANEEAFQTRSKETKRKWRKECKMSRCAIVARITLPDFMKIIGFTWRVKETKRHRSIDLTTHSMKITDYGSASSEV